MLSFQIRTIYDTSQTKIIASFNSVASFYDLTYQIRNSDNNPETHLILDLIHKETSDLSLYNTRDLHQKLWDLMTSEDFPYHTLETFQKNGLNFLSKIGSELRLGNRKFAFIQKSKSKPANMVIGNSDIAYDVEAFFLGIDLTKPAIHVRIENKKHTISISENCAASIAEEAAGTLLPMRITNGNTASSAILNENSELAVVEKLYQIFSKTKDMLTRGTGGDSTE